MNLVQMHTDGHPVTTSLAIAEGVEYPHKSVIQLIRQSLPDLEEFGRVAFEMRLGESLPQGGNARRTEYAVLNEQQATLLLTYMRNSDIVRAFKKALVRAFFAMRDQLARPEDLSRIEILQLAIDSEQQRLELERRALLDKPLVDFARQVEVAPDAISVGEAAKLLGTGRQRLFTFLRQIGWVTRRNEPYQSKIECGYLDVKLGSWEHPNHGLKQSVTTIVTGKGLVKLRRLWAKHHPDPELLTQN